jgi:hypothetical protein
MLRCEKCQHRDVSAKKYPCAECDSNVNDLFEPKKQTNAERIQSMSIDELAEFIAGLSEHCLAGIGACDCSGVNTQPCYEVCGKIAREWLQSEAGKRIYQQ